VLRFDRVSGCLYLTHLDVRYSTVTWPVGARPATTLDGRRGVELVPHGVIAEGDHVTALGVPSRVSPLSNRRRTCGCRTSAAG
jgi:hypothetical protein